MTDENHWRKWYELTNRPQIDQAIQKIYDDLGQAIIAKGPTCWSSGKCCNFNAYGHLLYVTGLEIAWYCRQIPIVPSAIDLKAACPFQVDGLCSTHTIRPLGCRVYFCQKGTSDWQQEIYEKFQQQLVDLHNQLAIPYAYMEWRHGLSEAFENRPS